MTCCSSCGGIAWCVCLLCCLMLLLVISFWFVVGDWFLVVVWCACGFVWCWVGVGLLAVDLRYYYLVCV